MSVDPDFEQRFDEYREHLHHEASRLSSYVRIYQRLEERIADRLHELNVAPAFFRITKDALFSGIVIWMHKFFDAKGERGLVNFLTYVEYNRDRLSISELKRRRQYPDDHWMLDRDPISMDTLRAHRERIAQLDALPSINVLRDKYHAHFDKEFFFERDRLAEETPITWHALDTAMKLIWDIINTYSTAFDGKRYAGAPFNVDDVDHLLDSLHRARKRRTK
jgi:hypothetical protein